MNVRETARAAYAAGLCVVPPLEDGSKRPVGSWKQWQHRRPDAAQMAAWYGDDERTGIGLITGGVSKGLECFEFDDAPTYEAFREAVEPAGLQELVARITEGYSETSPSGGVHWFYFCEAVSEGNTKLARRPKTDAEKGHAKDNVKVLIETRGEGGFIVVAPSHGKVHPTGKSYDLLAGGVENIATITVSERQELHRLARSFDLLPPKQGTETRAQEREGRPGDDYNKRARWEDILEPHGWSRVFRRGNVTHWRRPGKRDGVSATTNVNDSDLLYVFSSSTEFEPERGYSKFSTYALLQHSGDYAAAARQLSADGYGEKLFPGAGGEGGEYFPHTDAGNGELFTHLYGDRVRYDHSRGRWLLWDRHRWQADPNGELYRLALAASRHRGIMAAAIDNRKEAEEEFKFGRRSEALARIRAALDSAQNMPPIADTGKGWDAAPFLMGVANGVVDLATGELRPGRQDDRITKSTLISYDPEARCERWLRFLEEVLPDPELREFVHLAIGYSLTGSVREQCLFLLYGTGANGKSTFLDVLAWLAGEYGANMAFSTIEKGREQSIPADMAALAGARMVTASETAEDAQLNEARLKALAGGDPITARELFHPQFTFVPVIHLWLAVNHLPKVGDDSEGFWRRMRAIPFHEHFGPERRDDNLREALRAELPGILAWAVRGAVEWHRRKLPMPAAVAVATVSYRAESDPLAAFYDESCIITPHAQAGGSQLYKAYRAWAEAQGYRERDIQSTTFFGRRMAERFKWRHTMKGRQYLGIGLIADGWDPNPSSNDGLQIDDGFFGNRYQKTPEALSRGAKNASNPSEPVIPSPDEEEEPHADWETV